jgi:argonaute-like protein implicated in RNA metabolism and viral defense
MPKIQVGTDVEWTWGSSKAQGKVAEKFTKDVERKIKGKVIKRKADEDEPAFLVKQDGGDRVLKSQSELRRVHD